MELTEIEGIVRKIVMEIIASEKEVGAESIKVDGDDSLIEGGLIDSILAVQLIEECTMKFDIMIHPVELSLENFDSINKISQFVQMKIDGRDNEIISGN
jgi:acyl carrier protein